MSISTQASAELEAESLTNAQIAERLREIDDSPTWRGNEWDDVRVRHTVATRRSVLARVLAERTK